MVPKVSLPRSIMLEIDYVRDQFKDSGKAERYIVELLRANTLTISLKLYESSVSANPGVTAFGESISREGVYAEVQVPETMLRRPNKSFLLKVSGDSMIDAKINDGDIIAVERFEGEPNDKAIVLAYINDGENDQLVIKQYRKYKNRDELQSKNKKENYPSIVINKVIPETSQFILEDQRTVKVLGIFDTVIPAEWIDS